MSTQQRRPNGWRAATESSLAADPTVYEIRAFSRVRIVLDRNLVDDDGLTTEGRSRLWGLDQVPAGMQIVVDLAQQRYVIAPAVDLLVKAARNGAVVMFESHDFHVSQQWENAVRAGGWRA